jgi:hypothetical protein
MLLVGRLQGQFHVLFLRYLTEAGLVRPGLRAAILVEQEQCQDILFVLPLVVIHTQGPFVQLLLAQIILGALIFGTMEVGLLLLVVLSVKEHKREVYGAREVIE